MNYLRNLYLQLVRVQEEIEEIGMVFHFLLWFFQWLEGKKFDEFNSKDLFYSFMLSNPFNEKLMKKIDLKIILVSINGMESEHKLQYRILEKFIQEMEKILPTDFELKIKSDKVSVLDGELVVKKENVIYSFNELQKKSEKKVSKKS